MLKTVRVAVKINYRWISYAKTVRGDVNINCWWIPYA